MQAACGRHLSASSLVTGSFSCPPTLRIRHHQRWLEWTPSRMRIRLSSSSSSSTTAFHPRVETGRTFEDETLEALRALDPGLELEVVGGAGDRGIDLRGCWQLPEPAGLLRMAVQCKGSSRRPVGPAPVRDFSGALLRLLQAEQATRAAHWIGMFVARSAFTAAAIQAAEGAGQPLALARLDNRRITWLLLTRPLRLLLPQLQVGHRLDNRPVELFWRPTPHLPALPRTPAKSCSPS